MRMLWTLTALGCAVTAGAVRAADSWVEVKSKNFTVVSNAGESTARRTSAEFEQVRAAYERMWPGVRLAGRPTVVIALKDEGTLKRWVPGHYAEKDAIELASITSWGADRSFLLLRTDSRPAHKDVTPNYTLYQSYLTLLIANSFERRLPLWLSNGFAGVFANTIVRDTEISTGLPVPWKLQEFNSIGRNPLRVILEAPHDSPLARKDDERSRFDAQCYVLVHYLLFGGKERSQQLARFQQRWLSGAPADEALAAFGDLKALEAELPDYAKRPILSYAKFALDAAIASERPPARPLPAVDVLALQAAVHVSMSRPADARTAIDQARAADAQSPLPDEAEGLLADAQNDEARAAAAYARAAERGSVGASTHYRAAQLAWKSDADAALLALLRARLERAIELQPTHANAHSFLADVLVDLGEGAAAVAKALRAVELEPGESYHRRALARALDKAGRTDEAKKAAERALAVADSDGERSDAQGLLDDMAARQRARGRGRPGGGGGPGPRRPARPATRPRARAWCRSWSSAARPARLPRAGTSGGSTGTRRRSERTRRRRRAMRRRRAAPATNAPAWSTPGRRCAVRACRRTRRRARRRSTRSAPPGTSRPARVSGSRSPGSRRRATWPARRRCSPARAPAASRTRARWRSRSASARRVGGRR